jgi:hypothetical protein
LRILSTYSPQLNQPFFIGDGLTGNNGYGQPSLRTEQTLNIPVGASELLLEIGADPVPHDNFGPGFTVILTNAVPEPSALVLASTATLLVFGWAYRRLRRATA